MSDETTPPLSPTPNQMERVLRLRFDLDGTELFSGEVKVLDEGLDAEALLSLARSQARMVAQDLAGYLPPGAGGGQDALVNAARRVLQAPPPTPSPFLHTLRFYGASDDLVEFERAIPGGRSQGGETSPPDGGYVEVEIGDQEMGGCVLTIGYCGLPPSGYAPGVWAIGVRQFEEGVPFLAPVGFVASEGGYSVLAELDVPEETPVRWRPCGVEGPEGDWSEPS